MKAFARNLLRILSVIVFSSIIYFSLAATGYISFGSNSADAVSSATARTVSAEDMEGKYVVLVNREIHDKSGTTADWQKFFSFDDDVPLIMEDIECAVAQLDEGGLKTAQAYQSRLPENQMKITPESGIMLVSKAEIGRFDVIIMSEAAANAYTASTLYGKKDILTIKM